jgi:hypothetical protein
LQATRPTAGLVLENVFDDKLHKMPAGMMVTILENTNSYP